MTYALTLFRGTWEIRANDPIVPHMVCQGPMPNDEASGLILFNALKLAMLATNDDAVIQAMGEWAK